MSKNLKHASQRPDNKKLSLNNQAYELVHHVLVTFDICNFDPPRSEEILEPFKMKSCSFLSYFENS